MWNFTQLIVGFGLTLLKTGAIFFPITLLVAPLYAGVEFDAWSPMLLTYGGVTVGLVLVAIGANLGG